MKNKILEFLLCPITNSKLIFNKNKTELISPKAGVAYPIIDGIPVMIESEVRYLNDENK